MITQPIRQALDFGGRPDPALGILETVLVADGAAPLLGEHLERLRASARELYRAELASGLAWVLDRVPDGNGRMRVTFVPGGGMRVEPGPRPPDPVYTQIAPFALPGGLGPHKWADRRLVDALAVAAGAQTLPLLIDSDGAVLEVTWANVLIEEGGRLISPPADGRTLPGIGRRRLRYDEEPVKLDRLLAADAVVLTSALRTVRIPLRA